MLMKISCKLKILLFWNNNNINERIMNISFDNLPQAVAHLIDEMNSIKKMLSNQSQTQTTKPQNLNMEDAIKFMKVHGFIFSKSKIYKLTSINKIPCVRFGNRLIFNSAELLRWCESNTRSSNDIRNQATLKIVQSAQSKERRMK